jgi:hypothetical protein
MYSFSQPNHPQNQIIQEVFNATRILRKPIVGIISGYHQLAYILIAPDDEDAAKTVEIRGKINVSPKFIISPSQLGETFGEVFDPTTFDQNIQGRLFSFAYSRKKNLKIVSEYLTIKGIEAHSEEYVEKVHDDMMQHENISTALIFGPRFHYYPVSLDRFVNEIVEREFGT